MCVENSQNGALPHNDECPRRVTKRIYALSDIELSSLEHSLQINRDDITAELPTPKLARTKCFCLNLLYLMIRNMKKSGKLKLHGI